MMPGARSDSDVSLWPGDAVRLRYSYTAFGTPGLPAPLADNGSVDSCGGMCESSFGLVIAAGIVAGGVAWAYVMDETGMCGWYVEQRLIRRDV